MSRLRSTDSGRSSWFWGIVLSLSIHGVILLLALFWGFGAPKYSGAPQTIEGRLVSLSELKEPGGGSVKTPLLEKKEPPKEPKKLATKKEEPAKAKEERKEKKVEAPKPQKKEPPKVTKKEEPKKAETKKVEPPKRKEEPKQEKKVVLDPKEKKETKKEVAEKPEPTPPPKPIPQEEPPKKEEPSFEDIRRGVLEDMEKSIVEKQRRNVIEDIQSRVSQEGQQVADASSSDEESANNENYRSGRAGSRAVSGAVISLFIQRVREEIRSNWSIPPNIPTDGNLETVVVFRVDERGRVSDVRVDQPSGNPAFDDFCIKAIYKSSPLTPPPPELLEEAKREGFEITFNNNASI